ncbi:MAG: hypothetical protein Q8P18_02740 [Pseudomonadota bacterium]|nr:hypothetical protein [Pseudomonadota bacterium]
MLLGLLCVCLGTAWAEDDWGSADALKNSWSGEYDTPGNLTITVAPLRLAGHDFIGRGLGGTGVPMLDMSVEFRAGETKSFAITSATGLSRATGGIDDIGPAPRSSGIPGTGIPGHELNPGAEETPGGTQGYYGVPTPSVEVGLQIRDYVVGNFDNGLFLGGRMALINPDFRTFRADGTRFGPMGGLKVTLSIFTVEARGGADLEVGKSGLSFEPRVDFATGFTF